MDFLKTNTNDNTSMQIAHLVMGLRRGFSREDDLPYTIFFCRTIFQNILEQRACVGTVRLPCARGALDAYRLL
jgi:hypothetical protein